MDIDFSRLTRDYRVNPLKRGETIPKQDLEYLFLDANLTLKQMANIINRHPNQIGRQCKDNNVIKTRENHTRVKKEVPHIDVAPISNIQALMIQKFDVIIDYKNIWDYYIPSKDLYIMYHVDEKHGGQPFDPKNIKHWEIVKHWADEAQNIENTDTQKNYYAGLINTWTVSDVLARNTALHEKLNFIEFFTDEHFMDWYNKQ